MPEMPTKTAAQKRSGPPHGHGKARPGARRRVSLVAGFLLAGVAGVASVSAFANWHIDDVASPRLAYAPQPAVTAGVTSIGRYEPMLDADISLSERPVRFSSIGSADFMMDESGLQGPAPRPFGQSRLLAADLRQAPLMAVEAKPVDEDAAAAAQILASVEPEIQAEPDVPLPMPNPRIGLEAPLPVPRPAGVARDEAPAAVPDMAEPTKPGVRMRSRRTRVANAAPETDNRGFFEKLFGGSTSSGSALAYAPTNDKPGSLRDRTSSPLISSRPASASGGTAVYDISARTVYMPNGDRLEAHSGFGEKRDDPRHVNVSMKGATPPHTYDLTEREEPFHGVPALRLNPVGGSGAIYGRVGLLAHTYMLGPKGDSNGCISFRDYNRFLQAYRRGEVRRLVVVASSS